jgi:hypothetical protein
MQQQLQLQQHINITISESEGLENLFIAQSNNNTQQQQQPILNLPVIAHALQHHDYPLQSLDVSDCNLNDTDLESLIPVLCGVNTPNRLEELFLSRNQITDNGLVLLGEALPNVRDLKQISLWGNPFDRAGVCALCVGLKDNMDLQTIDLFRRYSCSRQIRYYTLLNQSGRRLLRASEEERRESSRQDDQRRRPIPLSIWPLVLERLQKIDLKLYTFEEGDDDDEERDFSHADLLFYMLKGPALLSN